MFHLCTKLLKKRWFSQSFLVFVVLGLWGTASIALGADCGTRLQPSFQASCRCPVRTHKGRIQLRARRGRRACIRAAVKKARQLCSSNSSKAKLSWSPAKPSSRKTCAITYTCNIPRTKHSGDGWSQKIQTHKGAYTYHFKLRTRYAANQCKKAANKAEKRMCRRTPKKKPIKFKWKKLRQRVRYFMGFKKGYCRIVWKCLFKKKQRAYWCAQ